MPAKQDAKPSKESGRDRPADAEREQSGGPTCPVVGIGTSAGGLAALKAFLEAVPTNSGLAYVIIQHLAPRHQSLTAQLLDTHTDMPVRQAEEGMSVEADHVYVIPPNAYLTLRDGRLSLSEPILDHGVRMPIDHFFRSLAEAHQQGAIGILLTGTGSDGTQGVKAIKGNGGMAMAQDPESAQFDGMVRSAIAAGLVDYVLPVEQMPEALIEFVRHAPHLQRDPTPLSSDTRGLEEILELLGGLGHHDFNCYKKGSLLRRIARRMALLHLQNMREYADYLRDHQDETGKLFQDLLISVTGFFRDPDHFAELQRQVLEKLVEDKPKREPLRIWVPGCASGEEAYTLAMLCLDLMKDKGRTLPLQIFATDINAPALEVARAGIYPESIAGDVSPAHLEQHFTRTDSSYRVSRELRSCITFAEQNLVTDPPYSRLDLISCRNLMIYLQPELQRKLLALFHFALVDGGYLFLGGSETVSAGSEMFAALNKQARIYRRVAVPRRRLMDLPLGMAKRQQDGAKPAAPARPIEDTGYEQVINRRLLTTYTPAAVLVDGQRRIRYSHGPVEHYLHRPPGVPTDDLLAQAREGLHAKLRTALYQAIREDRRVTVPSSRVRDDQGNLRRIRLSVEPATPAGGQEDLLLVVFEDAPEPAVEATEPSTKSIQDTLVAELEQELKTAREEQQRGIEDLESSNEELKSANEEVLSMNEELQSANEELETAKEELQSMNEELSTVNTELEARLGELKSANDDMKNLLAGTEIAMLFLDRRGRIKLFTPATRELFNIIPADVGRPLADIAHRMRGRDLTEDARNVLLHLTPLEAEVETLDARWYVLRVRPYRTEEDRIGGVVATFVDITERKRAEQSDRQLAAVVRDSNDAIIALGFDGTILNWNRGAEQMYGWREAEVLGRPVLDLVPADRRAETQALIEHSEQGRTVSSFETQRIAKNGGVLEIWLTVTAISDEDGRIRAITTTERDITERKRFERELQAARDAAERFSAQKTVFLASASHDLRQPLQTLRLLNTALAMQLEDDGPLEIVAQQGENLKAMKELLDSLLDVTRLDLGQVTPRTAAFAARELYRNVQDHFGEQARRKGLTLRTRPSNTLIRSDRHLLKSILYNLVSNAITHTERGKVLIGCRRRGDELRIEVWDTGPGIPEAELDTIFAEFHQLKNPARQRGKGLGLGLAITNRLANILGHRLEVRSTPGKGSMFAVVVPVETALAGEEPQRGLGSRAAGNAAERDGSDDRASEESGRALAASTRRVKVLLIEDDPGVANALGMLGEVLGFDWRWASQGEEALRLQREAAFEPDILISDFRLPGGRTGLEVIQALREGAARAIPAILLTGDVTAIQQAQVEEQGCSLMHKPVDGGELAALIRSLTATRAPQAD